MVMEIVIYGDNVLRNKSERVEDINDGIRELIDTMVETMHEAKGVGLAAPQIGKNLKIFVIEVEEGRVRKVINPEFLELSDEIEEKDEGCLSVPGIYQKVKRSKRVKVRYQDEKGKEVIEEAEGLLARAFQHEYDHLEGVLFVDKVSPIAKRLIKSKLKKLKRESLKK